MEIKHIFFTGRIQVGKSTLIRTVLSELENELNLKLEYDGFATYFDYRWNKTKKLFIERKTTDDTVQSVPQVVLRMENGKPLLETLAYETIGIEILESLDTKKLLIFDECGKFEKDSSKFIEKIEQILDEDTHVIGVLRKDDSIEWLQRIAERKDVCLIEVTEENRMALRNEVKKLMLELLGVK